MNKNQLCERIDEFDIRRFGYVDGMDDAGPAIQAAIDATPTFTWWYGLGTLQPGDSRSTAAAAPS